MDPHRLAEAAARTGGALLSGGTALLAAVRPARKPLHPDGEVRRARIRRTGVTEDTEDTGVAWLDEPGEDAALVRFSRAVGLPEGLPDIHGLAVRVRPDAEPGDLLFATTGLGRLTRFVLTGGRHPRTRPMTTLLPYRAPSGPVVLAAEARGSDSYELLWARPAGRWHRFAELIVLPGPGDDREISFDPMRHQLPGLRQYDAVRRLREPAYRRARASRSADAAPRRPGSSTRPATSSPTTEESPRVH